MSDDKTEHHFVVCHTSRCTRVNEYAVEWRRLMPGRPGFWATTVARYPTEAEAISHAVKSAKRHGGRALGLDRKDLP